ncbi:MAG: hypothetical protein ACI9F9_001438 [Candidatus Paceibacteria bacterium]
MTGKEFACCGVDQRIGGRREGLDQIHLPGPNFRLVTTIVMDAGLDDFHQLTGDRRCREHFQFHLATSRSCEASEIDEDEFLFLKRHTSRFFVIIDHHAATGGYLPGTSMRSATSARRYRG